MSKDAPCMKLCRRVCGILIAIKTEITPWYFPLFGRGAVGKFSSQRHDQQVYIKDMQAYRNWQQTNIREIQGPKDSRLIIYS